VRFRGPPAALTRRYLGTALEAAPHLTRGAEAVGLSKHHSTGELGLMQSQLREEQRKSSSLQARALRLRAAARTVPCRAAI
jgi:hypothetical protein